MTHDEFKNSEQIIWSELDFMKDEKTKFSNSKKDDIVICFNRNKHLVYRKKLQDRTDEAMGIKH